MCIIALDTRHGNEERLDRDVLERCFEKNPHGIGMMWPWKDKDDNPILKTWKSLDDFDGMWDRYTTVRDAGGIVAVHFRKTSVGDTNEANLHPFMYGDRNDFAFMHNGTIKPLERIAKKLDDGISDTRLFQKDIFNQLPIGWIGTPSLYSMVYNFIGRSRLLFMDAGGNWTIMNAHIGHWWPDDHKGKNAKRHVWFSNTKHKHYIQTGKEPRIITGGYGQGYNYADKNGAKKSGKGKSGADTKNSSIDSSDEKDTTKANGSDDGKPTRSEDSFYRRRASEVQREGHSIKAREVDWIFEYGDLQADIDGAREGLKYVGKGWMPGAQLYRVLDTHFECETAGVVQSEDMGDIVIGTLYRLDPTVSYTKQDILDHIDAQEGHYEGDPEASYFHRIRVPVYWSTPSSTNIIYPWVYFCNVSVNDVIEKIKHGSWALYRQESQEDDEEPSDQRDIEDPWYDDRDSPQCPRCLAYNTLAVEDYIEGYGYVEGHVYCKECQREFDANGNTFIRPVV